MEGKERTIKERGIIKKSSTVVRAKTEISNEEIWNWIEKQGNAWTVETVRSSKEGRENQEDKICQKTNSHRPISRITNQAEIVDSSSKKAINCQQSQTGIIAPKIGIFQFIQKEARIKESKYVKYSYVTNKLDKKTTAMKEK